MTTAEKRKLPRIKSINLAYLYLDKKNHITNHGTGKTINISEEGFLIETDIEITIGHSIVALIEIPENFIELKGKIMHCTPNGDNKYNAGVQLTETNESRKSVWKKFIDQIPII
jgi:Tfp pilus assembly protein PilZ